MTALKHAPNVRVPKPTEAPQEGCVWLWRPKAWIQVDEQILRWRADKNAQKAIREALKGSRATRVSKAHTEPVKARQGLINLFSSETE